MNSFLKISIKCATSSTVHIAALLCMSTQLCHKRPGWPAHLHTLSNRLYTLHPVIQPAVKCKHHVGIDVYATNKLIFRLNNYPLILQF